MKKIALAALALSIVLSFSAAAAQEWAPEGVDMGGSRTPMPMPAGVEISNVYPEYIPLLPDGYYLDDALYDGQAFILLYRDATQGGQEILMSIVQEEETAHALNYVEGSWEASSKKFLYFMLINGQTLHGSLYLFSIEDNRMNLVLEEPCSNNMVLFDVPPADIEGLGWVLWKDYILPIRLSDGSSYEGAAASIEMLGGMPEISGSFFNHTGLGTEIKYTYLTPVGSQVLKLTTVVNNTDEETYEDLAQQYYDCVTMQLIPAP